jgi:hypothetical protein
VYGEYLEEGEGIKKMEEITPRPPAKARASRIRDFGVSGKTRYSYFLIIVAAPFYLTRCVPVVLHSAYNQRAIGKERD